MQTFASATVDTLRRFGYMPPLAIFITPEGRYIPSVMFWRNDTEKDATFARARHIARTTAAAVVYVLDTWLMRHPSLEVPPSESAERGEAIVVLAFTPTTARALIIPFTRDHRGRPTPLQPQWVESPEIESRLDPWPQRTPPS